MKPLDEDPFLPVTLERRLSFASFSLLFRRKKETKVLGSFLSGSVRFTLLSSLVRSSSFSNLRLIFLNMTHEASL